MGFCFVWFVWFCAEKAQSKELMSSLKTRVLKSGTFLCHTFVIFQGLGDNHQFQRQFKRILFGEFDKRGKIRINLRL
jgi:hypothetical protein